jgi:hypothetical protein
VVQAFERLSGPAQFSKGRGPCGAHSAVCGRGTSPYETPLPGEGTKARERGRLRPSTWCRHSSTPSEEEPVSEHERDDDSEETSEEEETKTDPDTSEEERRGIGRDPLSDY